MKKTKQTNISSFFKSKSGITECYEQNDSNTTIPIRVGRCKYVSGKLWHPEFKDHKQIIVLSRTYKKWFKLSPFCLHP